MRSQKKNMNGDYTIEIEGWLEVYVFVPCRKAEMTFEPKQDNSHLGLNHWIFSLPVCNTLANEMCVLEIPFWQVKGTPRKLERRTHPCSLVNHTHVHASQTRMHLKYRQGTNFCSLQITITFNIIWLFWPHVFSIYQIFWQHLLNKRDILATYTKYAIYKSGLLFFISSGVNIKKKLPYRLSSRLLLYHGLQTTE